MKHNFPRGKDHCEFCAVSRKQAFVSRTECREVLWGAEWPKVSGTYTASPETPWQYVESSEPKPDAPDARLRERGAAMKSINTFARHADRSRTWVYQQIRAGHLEAVRAGKRYVITAEAERRFYQKVNSGELAEK
jgi:hypothetical protein